MSTRKGAYVKNPATSGLIVLAVAVVAYAAGHFAAPFLPGSFLGAYVFRPGLWLAAAITVVSLPRPRPAARAGVRRRLTEAAVIAAAVQIALSVALGAVEGFGKSPYSFSLTGILVNLLSVGAILAGQELSRAYLAACFGARRPAAAAALLTALYTLFMLPPAKLVRLEIGPETVRFAATAVLPGLAENLFATAAARIGGFRPALAYRGILEGFRWFCPVLPNLSWAMTALVGTLAPAVATMFLLQAAFANRRRRRADDGTWGWMATGIACVLLIWFSLGLFKVFPAAVVSGSMRPTFQVGDVVLVLRTPAEKIRTGDVIYFQQGRLPTVHRVVEIKSQPQGPVFVTKGDANRVRDPDPVLPGQVRGRVIARIPKIGWVSMAVRGMVELSRPHSPAQPNT